MLRDIKATVPSWQLVKEDLDWYRYLRMALVENFYMVFLDVVAIACWVLHVITGYKFGVLWTGYVALPYNNYSIFQPNHERLDCYVLIFTSTLNLIADLPFNILLLLSFHRIINVSRIMKQENRLFGQSQHRKICLQQFGEFLIDLPFIIMIFTPILVAVLLYYFNNTLDLSRSDSMVI